MAATTDIIELLRQEAGDDSNVVLIPDAHVGEAGRVTIPADQRDEYDIDIGDSVHAVVVTKEGGDG